MIKIKVFDLDGTILDSNGVWRRVDESFVGRHGLRLTEEYNEYVAHAIFPDAARFTKQYYGLSESEEEIMAAWYELAYSAYASELPLKPGAREYLKQCNGGSEHVVLYTSSQPSLCRAALEHHQITALFEQLFFAQEIGLEKKYVASFRQLSQMLGVSPEECLLYDDSPISCASAKEAGWLVVGIEDPFFAHHRGKMQEHCDLMITDFTQLL